MNTLLWINLMILTLFFAWTSSLEKRTPLRRLRSKSQKKSWVNILPGNKSCPEKGDKIILSLIHNFISYCSVCPWLRRKFEPLWKHQHKQGNAIHTKCWLKLFKQTFGRHQNESLSSVKSIKKGHPRVKAVFPKTMNPDWIHGLVGETEMARNEGQIHLFKWGTYIIQFKEKIHFLLWFFFLF